MSSNLVVKRYTSSELTARMLEKKRYKSSHKVAVSIQTEGQNVPFPNTVTGIGQTYVNFLRLGH